MLIDRNNFRREVESSETKSEEHTFPTESTSTESPERKARAAEEEETPTTESSEVKKPEKVR